MDNFTCGVDPSVDSSQHIAEQNTIYIFETFLDETKTSDPDYRTKVFDVLSFDKDGVAENMLENQLCFADMNEPGLYTLFLSPPNVQCNTKTFEDAVEADGVGYYIISAGVNGNFTGVVGMVKSSINTLKAFYNGAAPKLCGTKQKMKNETAASRMKSLDSMFNILYNAETERTLLPSHDRGCWSSDETLGAIQKANMFDLGPNADFEQGNSSLSASEADGFVMARITRTCTTKSAIVHVKTEFIKSGVGVSPAGPEDIVELDGPIVFKEGENTTEVVVTIKTDSDYLEDSETFDIMLEDGTAMKKRVKRQNRGRRRPVVIYNCDKHKKHNAKHSGHMTDSWTRLLFQIRHQHLVTRGRGDAC